MKEKKYKKIFLIFIVLLTIITIYLLLYGTFIEGGEICDFDAITDEALECTSITGISLLPEYIEKYGSLIAINVYLVFLFIAIDTITAIYRKNNNNNKNKKDRLDSLAKKRKIITYIFISPFAITLIGMIFHMIVGVEFCFFGCSTSRGLGAILMILIYSLILFWWVYIMSFTILCVSEISYKKNIKTINK